MGHTSKSCFCLCILGAFVVITVVVALLCGYYYCSNVSAEVDLEGKRLKEREQKRIREQKERAKDEARRESYEKARLSMKPDDRYQRPKPGKNYRERSRSSTQSVAMKIGSGCSHVSDAMKIARIGRIGDLLQ